MQMSNADWLAITVAVIALILSILTYTGRGRRP